LFSFWLTINSILLKSLRICLLTSRSSKYISLYFRCSIRSASWSFKLDSALRRRKISSLASTYCSDIWVYWDSKRFSRSHSFCWKDASWLLKFWLSSYSWEICWSAWSRSWLECCFYS
jgi:hypothetical protein